MLEVTRSRARRSDAERSRCSVLAAAVEALAEQPEATLAEIARSAGVTRQTVYAHFGSRRELLIAVVDDLTEQYIAALDAAGLDEGRAAEALDRFVRLGYGGVRLPPAVMMAAAAAVGPQESAERHEPIFDRVVDLVRRGQESGEFIAEHPAEWLATATIALCHAAYGEVATGRLAERQAQDTLLRSLRGLYGVA